MRGAAERGSVHPDVAPESKDWNADAYLCGTPGGVLDRRTGKIRAATRADLIRKTLRCSPAAEASSLWLRCIDEWTGGDKALATFMLRFCGMALIGAQIEHVFGFAHGTAASQASLMPSCTSFRRMDYRRTSKYSCGLTASRIRCARLTGAGYRVPVPSGEALPDIIAWRSGLGGTYLDSDPLSPKLNGHANFFPLLRRS